MATARPESAVGGGVTMHPGAMIRYMVTDVDGHRWIFGEYIRATDDGVVSMDGTVYEELHNGLAEYILVQRSGSF